MKRIPKAFTLIELLVVISIIALLLSILMPALTKIKKQARKILCANHLHQSGATMFTYAVGFDGMLPAAEIRNSVTNRIITAYDCKYIPSESYEVLASITDSEKIFVCPEYKLFKNMDRTGLTDPELRGIYDMVPFPAKWSDGAGWYLGYYYLGGHYSNEWAWTFKLSDAERWTSPLKMSDSGLSPLMADVVEVTATSTEAVHRIGGWKITYEEAVLPEEFGTEGVHVLHLDGSVIWKDMNKLVKYHRGDPARNNSCGYW